MIIMRIKTINKNKNEDNDKINSYENENKIKMYSPFSFQIFLFPLSNGKRRGRKLEQEEKES